MEKSVGHSIVPGGFLLYILYTYYINERLIPSISRISSESRAAAA